MAGAPARGGGARRRRGQALAASVVAAVLLHCAVLALAVLEAQSAPARLQPRELSQAQPSLQVRAVPAAWPSAQGAEDPAGSAPRLVWPARSAVPEPVRSAPTLAPLPDLPQALLTPEPFYLPRDLLSVGPAPQETVLLAWPAQSPLRGSFRGVLRLFINDEGQVRRVEAADAELPEPLFEAARQAFMAVRFSPGELDGRAVRSLIRVEVSFESESLPLAHE
jgi:protein TonB